MCSDEHAKEVKLLGLGAPLLARYRTLGEQFYEDDRALTVRMADSIVVIEAGAIQEQGSHAELIAKGGRYAELFSLQASGYAA